MAQNLTTNLHKSLADQVREHSFVKGLGDKFNEIKAKLPQLHDNSNAESLTGLFHVKKRILKGLNKKRNKWRLALESLGWGTLADLLDSALCGEQLNIKV